MLILSRKRHERIFIGNDIIISIAEISGNQVRIGIEAPQHISIQREEIRERYAHLQQGAKVES